MQLRLQPLKPVSTLACNKTASPEPASYAALNANTGDSFAPTEFGQKMTRRGFLRVLAAAAAGSSLLKACTSPANSDAPLPPKTVPVTQTGKPTDDEIFQVDDVTRKPLYDANNERRPSTSGSMQRKVRDRLCKNNGGADPSGEVIANADGTFTATCNDRKDI
jgi:hypothetical protein